jgi:hypothetical protein
LTLEEKFEVSTPSFLWINSFQPLSISYIFHGVSNYFLPSLSFDFYTEYGI